MSNYPTSPTKTWTAKEILTASDLNTEIQDIRNSMTPENTDDYSANVAEMQIQTDPGEQGTESLATCLAEELERIRFAIAEIKGTTYWYETASSNLSESQEQVAQICLPFKGKSVEDAYANICYAGTYNSHAVLDSATFLRRGSIDSSGLDSTDVKFGDYSWGGPTSNSHHLILPGQYRKDNRFVISFWFRNFPLSSTLCRNEAMGINLQINASGNLVLTVAERTAASETTKETQTVTGSTSVAANTTFKNVILEFGVNDAASDYVRMYLDGTAEGTAITGATINITPDTLGMWQFASASNPDVSSFDHFSAMSVLLKSEASDPWTGTEAAAVSDGVWTASGANDVENANDINLESMTLEIKAKFKSTDTVQDAQADNSLLIRDDSLDRSCILNWFNNGISLEVGTAAGKRQMCLMNTNEWHTYRITSSGNPSPTTKVFVDGVERLRLDNDVSDATASDVIKFVVANITGQENVQVEYIRWNDSLAQDADMPTTSGDGFNVSDIIILDGPALSSTQVSSFQSNAPDKLFECPDRGPTLLGSSIFSNGDTTTTSTTLATSPGASDLNHQLVLPADRRTSCDLVLESLASNSTTGQTISYGIGITADDSLTDPDLVGDDPTSVGSTLITNEVFGSFNLQRGSDTLVSTVVGAGATLVSIDFGTVAVGDVITVTAMVGAGSGDTGTLRKTAGSTSVIEFINDGAATQTIAIGSSYDGVFHVTTAGTLVLEVFGLSAGLYTSRIGAVGSVGQTASDAKITATRYVPAFKAVKNSSSIMSPRAALLTHATQSGTLTTRGESVLKMNLSGKGLLL